MKKGNPCDMVIIPKTLTEKTTCMKNTTDAHFRKRMILYAKQHGVPAFSHSFCSTMPFFGTDRFNPPPSRGGVDDALLLCDLLSLGIFLNQKQGYCILDAATLFSEKTVICEQRYSTDNVYRLSHIAVFVKIFLRKWLPLCRRTNAAKTCRHNQVNTNMLLST